jgi:HD-GYP domain-containing protein (c-di-GMP phosphodiesterase class II)
MRQQPPKHSANKSTPVENSSRNATDQFIDRVKVDEITQRYVERLKQALRSTVEVISIMGELRDPYTHRHERRVGELAAATAIAEEMGLDADRVEGIRIAGCVHDVGKISIPADILAKPSRLTSAEFDLVKLHPQQGHEILQGIDFPWPVAQIALQHHERLDGSGYPNGLKGDAILLEARIVAVADVVEAMASHRPYRPALRMDEALGEIEGGRGKKYDSAVVGACLRLFREQSYMIPA